MKWPYGNKHQNKIILALAIALLFNFSYIKAADTSVDDLNAQKAANQKKLEDLNKQIKDFTQQISTAQKAANTLKNQIFIYDKEIASTQLLIEAKKTQIDDTNLQINELNTLIQQKIKDIADNKKVLGELIKQLNEYDNEYNLKTTLGSNNLSDFLDQVQYTHNFQEKIFQVLEKIKDLKAQLEKQQKDLQTQLQTLQNLKDELDASQSAMVEQRGQKQALLNQTQGQERNYQKLLTTSKTEEDKIQQEINDLDAKIRAKLGNKSIPAAKGVLAWPIDGILTQGYGNTGFTALGYNFHNGIDIAAPAGAPIYAAADGTVYDIDHSNTSYGNWVAIKHNISTKSGSNQIVTLYGHMRTIIAKPGQVVQQGDLIGYEGNTGNTTAKLYGPERGYHVHFGVYDADGFGVSTGAYTKIYGPYKVPYGYTYNPLDFLGSN